MRLVGFLVLIGSSVIYSYVLTQNTKKRLAQLEDILSLIRYIKINIESFMTPISKILISFDRYSSSSREFTETAQKHGLQYAADHCTLELGENALRILKDFSQRIGSGYKEDEIRLCEFAYNSLFEIYGQEKEEAKTKNKMVKTLPIMSALSIALMLL